MKVIRDYINMQNKIEIKNISFDSYPYGWLIPYSYDVQVDIAINGVEHQIAFIAYYDSLFGDWMIDYQDEDFVESNITQYDDVIGDILEHVSNCLKIEEKTAIFAFNINKLAENFSKTQNNGILSFSCQDIIDILRKDYSTHEIFERDDPVEKAEVDEEMIDAFRYVFYLAFSRISKEDRKYYIDKCKKDSTLNTKSLMKKKNKRLLFNS